MDDLFFLVFVQCVARRAVSGFCACFVPVDLCSGWGVVILLAVSFVDLFPSFCVFLFVCSVAFPLCFFVCLPSWRGGVRLAHWGAQICCVVAWGCLFLRRDISWFMYVGQQCYVFWLFRASLLGLWGNPSKFIGEVFAF